MNRFVALAIALACVATVRAETVSLRTYRERILAAEAGREGARRSLARIDQVTLPDGRRVSVSGVAGVDLRLLDEAIAVAERPGDAAQQAKRILAAPEFAGVRAQEPSALERWLNDLAKRIARWLENLRLPDSSVNPKLDAAPLVRGALVLAVAVGAVLLAVIVLRRVVRHRRREGDDPRLDDPSIVDPLGDAAAAAGNADYRQALRLTYIAGLHALRDAHALTLEPSRTNGEYQRLIDIARPEIGPLLAPLTDAFDAAWYGGRTTGAADFATARTRLERLTDALKAPGDR